jgi:type II secretory pathway component HofQ
MLSNRTLAIILAAFTGACASRNATRPAVPQSAQPGDREPRLDLELADAELTDALAELAGNARINLLADSHVNDAGRVTLRVHAARWEDVLAKIAAEHHLRVEKLDVRGVDRPSFWISKQSSSPAPVTSFDGERITARFDDAPIREVAAALSGVAKTPIVVDDDVQASVTLHMRMPWDLALYHLAQKYDLRIVRGDAEIRISRP